MFQAGDSLRKAKRTYNKAKEKCRRAWINVRDAAQIVWKGTKLIVVSVVAPFTRLDGITIFTGALAFVAYLQWLTLEKTDQTLRAAQRPWMKYLNISVASPLTYNANGMAVTLSYLLKNTGNSPAQYVFPHTFGSINPGDFFDVAKQRLRCESERNRPSSAPLHSASHTFLVMTRWNKRLAFSLEKMKSPRL